MKTILLAVGRTVQPYYIAAINEYVERTKHYIPFDVEIIPELKNTKSLTEEQQKEREADLILRALQPGDTVVLLDEHGKEFRSVEFATWMERKLSATGKRLVFIIGGPYGFPTHLSDGARENLTLQNDLFAPDDSHDFCGASLSRHDDTSW